MKSDIDAAAPACLDEAGFKTLLAEHYAGPTSEAMLAIIEIQGLAALAADSDPVSKAAVQERVVRELRAAAPDAIIGEAGDGRFAVWMGGGGGAAGHRRLQGVGRKLAAISFRHETSALHLTPSLGYAATRGAASAAHLWEQAEAALAAAQHSLEIEPVRFRQSSLPQQGQVIAKFAKRLWSATPQAYVLALQFAMSLALALVVPFLIYAICDALGFDISGAVYIGVVGVLFLTATLIWIENLLALRSTEPPKEPAAPYPPATIMIPAYLPNEAETIVETLETFLRLDYPNTVQIIIAYNSPEPHHPVEDELAAIAAREARRGKFLIEPIRVHRSKSKAQNINATIYRVHGAFVGLYDADHHPQPDSLKRAWRWLSNGWDIVQGRCTVRNPDETWVTRMVAVEFEQIYAVSHPGRARFHGFGIFGGSNGFWRTQALHATRMRHAMLTEDIDSSMRALESGYRIAGDRHLISNELAPTTLNSLLNQRLRWAQGWFQVSMARLVPCLFSAHVSLRQKAGLLHLLLWRELFPWYSIQVIPILTYWVWIHGWSYLNWAIPIFVFTTVYTLSTGPVQTLFAYILAQPAMRKRPGLFLEYLITSFVFFSPFKDALARIAHMKEMMGEKIWRVTPRRASAPSAMDGMGGPMKAAFRTAVVALFLICIGPSQVNAQPVEKPIAAHTGLSAFTPENWQTLIGGQAKTVAAARKAAAAGRNAEAARLFEAAITAVPRRRGELLQEYADQLTYAGQAAAAVPLYRELLAKPKTSAERRAVEAQLALALSWSGKHQEALRAYEALLAQDPGNSDLALKRAQTLAWMGRAPAALSALDALGPQAIKTSAEAKIAEDIVIAAARDAAKTDKNRLAVTLFERSFKLNPVLRSTLMREYADQLTYSGRAEEAVPLYRTVLDRPLLSSLDRRRAQSGLATALGWSDRSGQAVTAWNEYLRAHPEDGAAKLHRAVALMAADRDAEALAAFEALLAANGRDTAARRGAFDAAARLARAGARSDDHETALRYFRLAMSHDPQRIRTILREYADQLSFNGQAGDAIPVYKEALAFAKPKSKEWRFTMIGLAQSEVWADRFVDAAGTYEQLAAAYPNDLEIRWLRLVGQARVAAQSDANDVALRLFEEARALKQPRWREVSAEYADQLSYAGRHDEAIQIYRDTLAGMAVGGKDWRATQKKLGQALVWADRLPEARDVYAVLVGEAPDDAEAKWAVVVTEARIAARADANTKSRELFSTALEMAPDLRRHILREYADQVSFDGDAAAAVALYQEVLGRLDLSGGEAKEAWMGLARAFSWSDQPREAKAAYDSLAAAYPEDQELRRHAVIAAARLAGAEDDNRSAAELFAQAMAMDPARRVELLLEYGDKLTYSSQITEAIPVYQEYLAQPDLPQPDERRARLALGLALSWNRRYPEAVAEYERLLATDPKDNEARMGLARIAAWTGESEKSIALYEVILAQDPDFAPAHWGLAEVFGWNGRHRKAQALLKARLEANQLDLESRRLLAQSYQWMGRPDKALAELDLIESSLTPPQAEPATPFLSLLPVNGQTIGLQDIGPIGPSKWQTRTRDLRKPETVLRDASKPRQEILSQQRPTFQAQHRFFTQSDRLDISQSDAAADFTFARGRARAGLGVQRSLYEPEQGEETTVQSAGVRGHYRLSDSFAITGDVWANEIDAPQQSARTEATFDVYATLWPNDTVRADLSLNRRLFDNVVSLGQGITADTVAGSVDFAPSPPHKASVRAAFSDYSDGNARRSLEAEALWRVATRPAISVGGRLFAFEFDEQLQNGYFNPDRYFSQEVLLRYASDQSRKWRFEFSASGGAEQTKPGGSKPLITSSARVRYPLRANLDLYADTSYFSSDSSGSEGFARTSVLFGLTYRLR